MRRKIEERLLKWKQESNGESALLVQGARRVGKSYVIEKFAKENYRSYVLIDFGEAASAIKELFNNYLSDLDTFFLYLQSELKVKLYPRESVIIFDEVQRFPRAREAIKYLVADGRYDYIETGSLISIRKNVENIIIPSEEDKLELCPMDFEEFLWAMGEEELQAVIRQKFVEKKPMEILHRKTMGLFRQYLITGGMPQAVEKFRDTRDLEQVDQIKRRILGLYRDDIAKFGLGDAQKIRDIFELVPSQLQHRWKKFTLAELGSQARMREYAQAFTWLDDAKIVNVVRNTTDPNIGMGFSAEDSSLKCYMGDTGLLLSLAFAEKELVGEDVYRKILFGKLAFNEGMIFENVVSQMLRAAGHRPFFYTNNAEGKERMEMDFVLRKPVITSKHNILPIEVKSGTHYSLVSLHKYLAKYREYCGPAYVIHTDDLRIEQEMLGDTKKVHEVRYLPVYMTGLL